MRYIPVVATREFHAGGKTYQVGDRFELEEPLAFYEFTAGHRVVPAEDCIVHGQEFKAPENLPKKEKKVEEKTKEGAKTSKGDKKVPPLRSKNKK